MSSLELNFSKTAVVVLDVQPVIISMVPGSEEVLPNILRVIDAGQKASCLTVYIRVAFEHEEWANIGPNVKNFHGMKTKMGGHDQAPDFIHADSETTRLHPEVDKRVPKGDSIHIRKTRFGPFSNTGLLEKLQSRNIDTLILVGFKTSGAVLSTVRVAADHDFKVIVVADAVTDPDAQCHNVLIEKVFPEQGHVIETSELEAALEK